MVEKQFNNIAGINTDGHPLVSILSNANTEAWKLQNYVVADLSQKSMVQTIWCCILIIILVVGGSPLPANVSERYSTRGACTKVAYLNKQQLVFKKKDPCANLGGEAGGLVG